MKILPKSFPWLIIGLAFLIIATMFAQQLPSPDENPMEYTINTIYMLASLLLAPMAWIYGEILDVKEEIRRINK